MTFETYFKTCGERSHTINQTIDESGNVVIFISPDNKNVALSYYPEYRVQGNQLIELTPIEDVE